jgi:type II secretory pathway pseudopilin PulG
MPSARRTTHLLAFTLIELLLVLVVIARRWRSRRRR